MGKRQNTLSFPFTITLSVLAVTVGWLALDGVAQDSFRANIALPENDSAAVEKNTESATKTLTDRTPPRKEDPSKILPADADLNAADSLDTILVGAESIQIIPAGTDPVAAITSLEAESASTSEKEAIEDKDSQNASPPASGEKEYTAESVSPWENQVLGQHPEKADSLSAKEQNQSSMPSPWKTLVSLVIVLALIVGVTYLFKRFSLNANRNSMPAGVEILARSSMNPKQSLCLVQLGNRLVLLGQSPNHISSLQTIDDPDEIAQIMGQLEQKKTLSISNTFGKLFHREKELYENYENPAISLDIEDNQDQNQPNQPWCQAKGELSSLFEKVKGLSKIRFRS